jgi:uncharacterized protein (DUF2147 family)
MRRLHLAWGIEAWTVALVLAAASSANDAATPVGTWQQFDDRRGDLRSIIQVEQAGGELVGTIVKVFRRADDPPELKCVKCPGEFRDKPVEGLRFLWGLKGSGREWTGGRVLDPDDGKIYRVKVKLTPDGKTLEVRGYIGISLLGRTQRWKRAEP